MKADAREQAELPLHDLERQFRELLEEIRLAAVMVDIEGNITFCNDFLLAVTGWQREEVVGKDWFGIFVPPEVREYVRQVHIDVITSGRTEASREYPIQTRQNERREILWNSTLLRDLQGNVVGIASVGEVITERRLIEEKLIHINRLFAVLSDANRVIIRTNERDTLLAEICHLLVEQGLFRMVWIGLVSRESGNVKPLVWHGFEEGYLGAITVSAQDVPEGQGPMGRAIRLGEHVVCNDIEGDPRMAPWREEALARGYRSSAAFPLRVGDTVIGALEAYADQPRYFGLEETLLLRDLADDLSAAMNSIKLEAQRRMTEVALRESEKRYRTLVENLNDVLFTLDVQGRVTYASPVLDQLYKYKVNEVVGQHFSRFVHPDDLPKMLAGFGRTVRGRATPSEYRMLDKDGSVRYVRLSGRPLLEGDQVVGVTGLMSDITERKQAEEALTRSEAKYRAIVEDMPALMCRFRPDGTLSFVNDAYCRCFQKTREELVGSSVMPLIPEEDYKKVTDIYKSLDAYNPVASYEHRVIMPDGEIRWQRWTDRALFDEQGNIFEYQSIGEDITERKRMEEGLSKYRAELERRVMERTRELAEALEREKALTRDLQESLEKEKELAQLKSRFVSMASHEFRTPLSTILSSTDILARYGERLTRAQQCERFDRIREQIRNMTMLLDEVLIIGKADAGRLEFNPIRLDLERFCRGIVQQIQDTEGQTHIIRFASTVSFPGAIFSVDEKLARHIVVNLLSNAVKYSPEGSTVDVELKCEEPHATLRVRDEGIGIPEKDIPHLFEPFHRGSNVGDVQGTGLGLAILRRAVDLHHGTVTAESEAGRGTTFTVTLPRQKERGAKSRPT